MLKGERAISNAIDSLKRRLDQAEAKVTILEVRTARQAKEIQELKQLTGTLRRYGS
jgi:uncharacterized coiled-coil protein SlyX